MLYGVFSIYAHKKLKTGFVPKFDLSQSATPQNVVWVIQSKFLKYSNFYCKKGA